MTPLVRFDMLQSAKTREEFIKLLREHRPIDKSGCDKCNYKRRCKYCDEL